MHASECKKNDLYLAALFFVSFVDEILEHLTPNDSYLSTQLQQVHLKVPLYIAEGGTESLNHQKTRFYRKALLAAEECSHLLDVCGQYQLVDIKKVTSSRHLLQRILFKLRRMII